MDALIALRIKAEKQHHVEMMSLAMLRLHLLLASADTDNQGGLHMKGIEEVEMSDEGGSSRDGRERNDAECFRPAPLQVLDHVKINVDPDTPVSTIKNVVMSSKLELSYRKDELRKAFVVEFHQQLRLLKSYSFSNMLAFPSMKKYDKITSRHASKITYRY